MENCGYLVKVTTNSEMAYAAAINIHGGHWENLTNSGEAKPLNRLHILKADILSRGYSEVFCTGSILKIVLINAFVRKDTIYITVPILDVAGHSSLFQMLEKSTTRLQGKIIILIILVLIIAVYLYYKSSINHDDVCSIFIHL